MTTPTAQSAIRTRYHGPTDTRGSRFVATDGENRVTVPYDYSCGSTENHCIAAHAFLAKYNPFETNMPPSPHIKLAADALCFGSDFYWAWEITGPRKAATASAAAPNSAIDIEYV